ncbi:unnamed protein product [Closterium sp. Yama58-4]|nr:unnamed protein product [Closterium sp. Yama58-4]
MASSGASQQAVKAVAELAKRLRPSFVNGKWRGAEISAKNRARLRRETLLAGEEWRYDAPRKEMNTKMKGHKHDKEAAVRQEKIAENMAKMPELLEQMKRQKRSPQSSSKARWEGNTTAHRCKIISQ